MQDGNTWIWQCVGSGSFNQVDGCTASVSSGSGSSTSSSGGTVSGGSSGGTVTGAFHVQNGQIIAPNGQTFIARGIDLHSDNLAVAAAQVPSQFPGINLIRATPRDYESLPDPSSFADAVNSLTALGIVIEFTDYGNSLGTGSGGGQGYIYTGSLLDTENAWYSAMASFYINNPYVWFGTNNEPSVVYPDGNVYSTGPNSLAAWQSATYNAVRSTGNNNPIFLEVSGDAVGNFRNGAGSPLMSNTDPSYIAPMTNVIWDPHVYPYMLLVAGFQPAPA
jgi:Cellulase (glycosyl hydrolase family 5)